MIDPGDHVGLARSAAVWAAQRWGGERDEWLGPAYLALHGAARNFRPELGFTFSTYAVRCMRLQLIAEMHRRLGHQLRVAEKGGPQRWTRPPAIAGDRARCDPDPGEPVPLDPREEEIVRLRLRGTTLALIGERVGCSKERVRQILEMIAARAGVPERGGPRLGAPA